MGNKVHYPAELKWKAIEMKNQGYTRREIMDVLGIKNVTQLKRWMRWYRDGEDYRFNQPIGKQYTYGKGPEELNETDRKDLEIRHLKAKVAVLEKFVEISRGWDQKS